MAEEGERKFEGAEKMALGDCIYKCQDCRDIEVILVCDDEAPDTVDCLECSGVMLLHEIVAER